VSNSAFTKQEVINVTALDPMDMRCPTCHTNTLVLSGQAQLAQREVMENGVVVSRVLTNPSANGTFDVTRLDCVNCSTTFHIRNAEVFRLEAENLELKSRIGELMRKLKSDPEGGSGSLGPEYGFRN
jgi:hypothetical protein